ncbi:unnamed protein product, partial [Symbiodinium sp. KB8]
MRARQRPAAPRPSGLRRASGGRGSAAKQTENIGKLQPKFEFGLPRGAPPDALGGERWLG